MDPVGAKSLELASKPAAMIAIMRDLPPWLEDGAFELDYYNIDVLEAIIN